MASSTRKQYHQALNKCKAFIGSILHQSTELPFSQRQIHLYVAHLHTQNYKHSTIATQLAAISHYHKMASLPDPTSTYASAKLLTGVKKTQCNPPDARQPITKQILEGLIVALHPCSISRYEQLLYSALFSMMYHACLRASEVLLTENHQHILQLSQLEEQRNKSYKLQFTSYKHATSDRSKLFIMPTGDQACPVHHMSRYLQVRGKRQGPIFINKGAPVTRQQFTTVLNRCLTYLQISTTHYNTHSFRIGRTTDLALANVPHSTIQNIGRWKSNAYLKYVRPQFISTNPR